MTVLFFMMINCVLRGVLTTLAAGMLLEFYHQLRITERIGLAFFASGSLLTVPIAFYGTEATPFDGWSGTILTAGGILVLWGRGLRLFKHHVANIQHAESLHRELRERQK